MEAKQFVLETKGHCLLCLHKSPPPDQASVSEAGHDKMEGDDDEEESVSKLCSIQRVSRYMKLDRKKIFKDLVAASPPVTAELLLPILERAELKGLLCGGCAQLTGRISDVALKLELLQMTLDSLFGALHHKMDNEEAVEEFRREMWGSSDSQTLLQYGIVDKLRKETMNKSFSLIQKAQPRVGLKRFEIIHVDPSVPVPGLNVEEKPPLCLKMKGSPIAVITSVQGSYRKDESDPSASTAASTTSLKITMHQSQSSVTKPSTAGSSSAPGTQEDPPVPPLPKMSLDCKICKKSYQNMRDRRDHQRTVHEGYKFQCGLCPATFTFRTERFRHQKQVHGVGGTRRPRQENQSAGRKRRIGKKRRPKSSSSASKKMVNSGRRNSGPSTSSRDVVVLPPSNLATSTTPRSDLPAPNPRISNGWLNRDVEIIEIDDDDEDTDTATANLTLEPESESPKPQPPPEEDSDFYTVYQCQYCYKTFQNIERLRCHEAILHKNVTSSDPRPLRPESKYECDICGKKFIYNVLARHRQQVHKQDEVQIPSSSASGSTAIPSTSSSALATTPSVQLQPAHIPPLIKPSVSREGMMMMTNK